MTSHGHCPRGEGACECLHPPPSGNTVSAPVFHLYPSSDPPPPGWLAVYGPVYVTTGHT